MDNVENWSTIFKSSCVVFLSPLKFSESHRFSDNFKGNTRRRKILWKCSAFFNIMHETLGGNLTVIWVFSFLEGGGNFTLPSPLPRSPDWFSHNNWEMVKAETLASTWDIRAKFGIPNSPQSPDIGQNSDGGISDFWSIPEKENYHNSRTSDNVDMKLEPVTKLDKRNKGNIKRNWRWRHVGQLWLHCHFSDLWPIWGNLEAGFRTHSL